MRPPQKIACQCEGWFLFMLANVIVHRPLTEEHLVFLDAGLPHPPVATGQFLLHNLYAHSSQPWSFRP
jgi:hypothetical protein